MLRTEKSQNQLLWLVSVGIFMETLDSTIVNAAIPKMALSLGESALYMQSVVIAYSLTIALLIPACGWLAERFGTRRIFFSAILLFTLGSLCCAISQTLLELVLSRVLQGCGGAMLLPVGRLSVLKAFPKEKFLEAFSFVAVPGLIGPLVGPTLGGFLVQTASWHSIFLINIPIGIAGCVATSKFMPDYRSAKAPSFDWAGFFMLAISMFTMSLALEGLTELHLEVPIVLILFIFAFAGIAAYVLHAARHTVVLFSLQLFKIRTFSVGLLGNLFARIGSSSMPFLLPLFLQTSLEYTPLQSGLIMVPVALAAIFSKKVATPIILKTGYRKFLLINTILVGLSIAGFGFITREQSEIVRIIQLTFFGIVNSLQFSAMNSLTLKDLDTGGASSGNTLFSMVQMLALSFGVATAGAMLTTFSNRLGNPEVSGAPAAFHATFFCVGLITCTSAWIFAQLAPETSVMSH